MLQIASDEPIASPRWSQIKVNFVIADWNRNVIEPLAFDINRTAPNKPGRRTQRVEGELGKAGDVILSGIVVCRQRRLRGVVCRGVAPVGVQGSTIPRLAAGDRSRSCQSAVRVGLTGPADPLPSPAATPCRDAAVEVDPYLGDISLARPGGVGNGFGRRAFRLRGIARSATCRSIVEGHRGRLWASPRASHGATIGPFRVGAIASRHGGPALSIERTPSTHAQIAAESQQRAINSVQNDLLLCVPLRNLERSAPPSRAQADGSPRTWRSKLVMAPPSNGFSR